MFDNHLNITCLNKCQDEYHPSGGGIFYSSNEILMVSSDVRSHSSASSDGIYVVVFILPLQWQKDVQLGPFASHRHPLVGGV